jgi:putative flavoprotein involved in K+ transport
VLQRLGVVLTGRLERLDGTTARFAGDLRESAAAAEARMHRLLDRIDEHVERALGGRWAHEPHRLPEVRVAAAPRSLDLVAAGISAVVWATGYRRSYPWLHVPALGPDGELVQREGVTPVPGLYALGLKLQRRRFSHQIGGVGADAAFLAARIAGAAAARSRPARIGRERPAALAPLAA